MRCQAAIGGANRPAVAVEHASSGTRSDDRLNRYNEALVQPPAVGKVEVVRYGWFFVNSATDAVSADSRSTLKPLRRTSRSTARPIS